MQRLNTLRCGQSGRIVGLDAQNAVSQRLASLGLIPGTPVKIVQVAPLGDPITIELLASRISVRRQDAAALDIIPD